MAPKKKVLAVVKIQLEAGSATPAPPVGTALFVAADQDAEPNTGFPVALLA